MVCVTSKCCFCAPLWLGLLTWAYIKLIFTAVSLGIISITFFEMLRTQRVELFETLIMCYVVLLSVFTVMFLIGLQYGNYKLLFGYYLFSMFEVLVGVGCIAVLLYIYLSSSSYEFFDQLPSKIISLVAIFVGNILLPIYFMVLIRSELLKLKAREVRTLSDVCTDIAIAREQHFANPDSQETVPKMSDMPVYPVDELERMIIQQLRVQNV